MYYGITNSLRGFNAGHDANASAYISAVVAAGATVSKVQSAAVHEFYRRAKGGGYYASLKRLYLPIWGVAAANAIDMIGLTSGTFVGGVTHAAGYVQGNGTTGYFKTDVNCNSMFSSQNNWAFGMLSVTRPTSTYSPYMAGGNAMVIYTDFPYNRYTAYGIGGSSILQPNSNGDGCLIGLEWDGSTRRLIERYAGSTTVLATNSIANDFGLPADPMEFLAATKDFQYGNAKMGAGWCANSLGVSNSNIFMSAMQTLWQTTTGLTLP